MLRWLASVLVLLPLSIIVVLFAVSNRAPVTAELFPLPFVMEIPLYLLVLVALLAGLLAGAVLTWVSGHRIRVAARRESKRARQLEKELTELRINTLRADAPPPSGSRSAPLLLR